MSKLLHRVNKKIVQVSMVSDSFINMFSNKYPSLHKDHIKLLFLVAGNHYGSQKDTIHMNADDEFTKKYLAL